jgi:hypothetical protein
MFPDDQTLIARGKYSTLGRKRHEQLERLQKICTTVIGTANHIMRDAEQKPPTDLGPLKLLEDCLHNAQNARALLLVLSVQMNELENEAWPK